MPAPAGYRTVPTPRPTDISVCAAAGAGAARVAGVAALGLRVTSTSGWSTAPRRCFARWMAPWECNATMALPWSDACSLGICGVCAANSVGTAHTAASPKSLPIIEFSLRREVGDRLERSARPLPRQQDRTGPAAGDFTQPGCNRRVGRLDEAGGAEPDVCERLGDHFVRFSRVNDDAIGERVHAATVTLLELAQCRRITARHPPEQGVIRHGATGLEHRSTLHCCHKKSAGPSAR